jgi:hypothetical protein
MKLFKPLVTLLACGTMAGAFSGCAWSIVSVVRDTGPSSPQTNAGCPAQLRCRLLDCGATSLASFAPLVREEFSNLAVGHRGQAAKNISEVFL